MKGSSPIARVVGIDFSGARQAGENLWCARATIREDSTLELDRLERPADQLAATDRDLVYAHLRSEIASCDQALFGIDFPFGLPIELGWSSWDEVRKAIREWPGDAMSFGRHCCERAMAVTGRMHIRRTTDIDTRTPFDCYHYRIVHQMFYGIRDVLDALSLDPATCIMPFQASKLDRARRVVVEACPGSTLRRLGLPFNRYKQTGSGPMDRKRRATREKILDGLRGMIEVSEPDRKQILSNRGGDALDAVIAAVGTWDAWRRTDVSVIQSHPRYPHEGMVYC